MGVLEHVTVVVLEVELADQDFGANTQGEADLCMDCLEHNMERGFLMACHLLRNFPYYLPSTLALRLRSRSFQHQAERTLTLEC